MHHLYAHSKSSRNSLECPLASWETFGFFNAAWRNDTLIQVCDSYLALSSITHLVTNGNIGLVCLGGIELAAQLHLLESLRRALLGLLRVVRVGDGSLCDEASAARSRRAKTLRETY